MSTYVIRSRIFSLEFAKVHSAPRETDGGDLGDTDMVKAVNFSLGNLFPTAA